MINILLAVSLFIPNLFNAGSKIMHVVPEHINIRDFEVSPSEEHVFVASSNRIDIYEIYTRTLIDSILFPDLNDLYSIALSKDSTFLIGGTKDGFVAIYNNYEKQHLKTKVSDASITAVDINIKNDLIVIGDFAGVIYTLNINGDVLDTFNNHSDVITDLEIDNQSEFFISSGLDGKINVYNLKGHNNVRNVFNRNSACFTISMSHDRREILAAFKNGWVHQLKTSYDGKFKSFNKYRYNGWITGVSRLKENSACWAICSTDGNIRIKTAFAAIYSINLRMTLNEIYLLEQDDKKLAVLVIANESGLLYVPATSMKLRTN